MAKKTTSKPSNRPGRLRPEAPAGTIPYTMRLTDGRTVFVELPARMALTDKSGETAFTAEGVRLLDRVRSLASGVDTPPSPAQIATMREAAGLTQEQLGQRIGKSKLTVSRWERGAMRPSGKSTKALASLFRRLKRSGVVLPG